MWQKKGTSLTQFLGGNAIIARQMCGTRIHRDWPFAFLAMWFSVVLRTALLQMSLTAPRFRWRSSQVKSSFYSPQSKEQNPQQAEQGHAQMQQCV
jgi:hypothetical protein